MNIDYFFECASYKEQDFAAYHILYTVIVCHILTVSFIIAFIESKSKLQQVMRHIPVDIALFSRTKPIAQKWFNVKQNTQNFTNVFWLCLL